MLFRLKYLRASRGYSLADLAAAMGGIVTRQAIAKYESGKVMPSPSVLAKLASTLRVRPSELSREPTLTIELQGFRKKSRTTKRECERVRSVLWNALEQRIHLQSLLPNDRCSGHIHPQSYAVATLTEAEQAASNVRQKWKLGVDPIPNMTACLEDQSIHVVPDSSAADVDGVAALARSSDGKVMAAGVMTRTGAPGERQRLSLAHELGHLLLSPAAGLDEEKAAFRFGAAFLAPAEIIKKRVGDRRARVDLDELLILKRQLGISMQSLVFRLCDLGIISEAAKRDAFIEISSRGWRTSEPDELPPEIPEWLDRTVLRLLAEGLISQLEAERVLARRLPGQPSSHAQRLRALLAQPVAERSRVLEEESAKLEKYYSDAVQRGDIDSGDVCEE